MSLRAEVGTSRESSAQPETRGGNTTPKQIRLLLAHRRLCLTGTHSCGLNLPFQYCLRQLDGNRPFEINLIECRQAFLNVGKSVAFFQGGGARHKLVASSVDIAYHLFRAGDRDWFGLLTG